MKAGGSCLPGTARRAGKVVLATGATGCIQAAFVPTIDTLLNLTIGRLDVTQHCALVILSGSHLAFLGICISQRAFRSSNGGAVNGKAGLSMTLWQTLQTIQDTLTMGCRPDALHAICTRLILSILICVS